MGERPGTGLVLIIDDDEPILRILNEVVVDLVGANALAVPSEDLVDDTAAPDLVISDLVGRDVDRAAGGRAYLARLRARFGGTPLVLVTARHWVRSGRHALPVDAVVLKPFDLDDLARRISALLAATSARVR